MVGEVAQHAQDVGVVKRIAAAAFQTLQFNRLTPAQLGEASSRSIC